MTIQALSSTDLQKLDDGLKKALGNPPATVTAAISAGDIEQDFCTIWPKASPILTTIAKYVGLIPGVGGTAAAIINGLVTAGDTLSGAVCPKST
jgi:hypothetical protein